jgi:hypothetical protein|tara:strand:+ start:2759 stop:3085 length:327 start_codon:yes stop_codon:yes gene_type:complete
MTFAVLIHETKGHIEQIELDIAPHKNEIFTIIGGTQTFIGQWPDIDVVILKAESSTSLTNENKLPKPFEIEEVNGKILLVRMDENSEHQDFTLDEYKLFSGWDERVTI